MARHVDDVCEEGHAAAWLWMYELDHNGLQPEKIASDNLLSSALIDC